MKALGSLATLFSVTLRFASAGPLIGAENGKSRNGSGAQICDTTCEQATSKFNYLAGHSYIYKYSTRTETALELTSEKKSTIYLDADVSLQVLGPCRIALKVESAYMAEEISGGSRRPSRGTEVLTQNLTKHPLIFYYDMGVVTRLCPSVGEPRFSLNIKRGILSIIQNTMANLQQPNIAFDNDIMGECHTEYSVKNDSGGQLTILRRKSLSTCRSVHEKHVVSAIALPRKLARSSSIINGTQQCEQTVKNKFIHSVECHEQHVVRPLSLQRRGATTSIHQILRFQRVDRKLQSFSPQYAQDREESIEFDSRADNFEDQREQIKEEAKGILQHAAATQYAEIKQANGQFSRLVELLRQLDYSSLKTLVSEFPANKWLYDVLTTITGRAMRLTAELVNEKVIGTKDAKAWLLRAAFATEIDASEIASMMKLLDVDDIVLEAHLTVSALARTYMEENPSEVPKDVHNLLNKLYSQLKPETSDQKLTATIKAIGNLGMSNGLELQLIEVTREKNLVIRLAALEAFRRFPCDQVNREPLLKIFASCGEETEVRIEAYLNSIVCPTPRTLATVKQVLLKESEDRQVASFVFTHIKNLEKSSSFAEDLSSITSDESLESLQLDSGNFSKNHFYELFLDPFDMGFEIDAGLIFSNGFNSFRLNTTFDIFGQNVNLFDGKIRLKNDTSSLDGFWRFFGREVFHKNINKKEMSKLESIFRSVMSPEGLQFNESMLIMDIGMVVPTGNGFSLTVAVNGSSSVAINVKAMPPQKVQGTNTVAEARAALSLAVKFEISMTVSAARTSSGIKMLVTAFSQWDIDGKINRNNSDKRMVGSIRIGVPRERSDLIDIRSDVYLVGADSEENISSKDCKEKRSKICGTQATHIFFGHKICFEATYPEAINNDAPFFFVRGPSHLNVYLMKTDKLLKSFDVASSFSYGSGESTELAFIMDTPGSVVDRRFEGRVYHDIPESRFGVDLISPLKKIVLEGAYKLSSQNKHVQILMKVDGQTEVALIGGMDVTESRFVRIWPFLEVSLRGKLFLLVKSQVLPQTSRGYRGEVEIQSTFKGNQEPIRLNGEYSTTKHKTHLNFEIYSHILKSNVACSLTQNAQNWTVGVEGDYIYGQAAKQMFAIGAKLVSGVGVIQVEGTAEHNGITIANGEGHLVRRSPVDFSVRWKLLDGEYEGKLSLATENQERALNAIGVWDSKKYATRIIFRLRPQLTSVTANFSLPDGVERMAQLQYDFNGTVKRFAVETDLPGSVYSARLSYVPRSKTHKVSAKLLLAGEKVLVLGGLLATGPHYQAKVDITRNDLKLLVGSFAFTKNLNRVSMEAMFSYYTSILLDVSTNVVLDSGSVSVLVSFRAPVRLNGTAGLRWRDSPDDNHTLGSELDIRGQHPGISWGLISAGEYAVWSATKTLSLEIKLEAPRGPITLVFKYRLGYSNWSIDWILQMPDEQLLKVSNSGVFKYQPSKIHMRGVLEVGVHLLGRQFAIEPHSFSVEVAGNGRGGIEVRIEITDNAKTAPVLLVGLKGADQPSRKKLSAELNIMGSAQHIHWNFDSLKTGWESSLDARWRRQTIFAGARLRFDGGNVDVGLDFESSHEALFTVKFHLLTATVGANDRLISAEYILGEQVFKAEARVDRNSFEAEIRSSVNDWRNVKAKASWLLEPKMRLTVDFSSPKYVDNFAEIVVDNRDGINAMGRLVIPLLYQGDLIQAIFDHRLGQSKLRLIHRGQRRAELCFSRKNAQSMKSLTAAFSYALDGVTAHQGSYQADFEHTASHSYDLKLAVVKDLQKIIDMRYSGALRREPILLAESKLEVLSSLLESWEGVWLSNKLVIDRENVHTEHEFGSSPSNVLYSVGARGRFHNNRNMLVLQAQVDGQWRALQGSISAEVSSNKKNNAALRARVGSRSGNLLLVQWALVRQGRLVEVEASWEVDRTSHQAAWRMRSGLEEKHSFVFESRLGRDRDVEKTTEVALRLPLTVHPLEGHIKVKLSRELGGRALIASVTSHSSLFNAKVEVALGDQRDYCAETTAKWDRGFSLGGMIRKNSIGFAEAVLSARWRPSELYEVSLALMSGLHSYGSKLGCEWTEKSAKLLLEAESTQWERKHSVRGFYSRASRSSNLKVDIANMKLTLNSTMTPLYVLQAHAQLENETPSKLQISFDPNSKQGSIDAVFRGKRFSTLFVTSLVDGPFKLEDPSGSSELTWCLDPQNVLAIHSLWTFRNKRWRLEISAGLNTPANVRAVLHSENSRVCLLDAQQNPNELSIKLKLIGETIEHSFKLDLRRRKGFAGGVFHLQCPWISAETINSKLELEYSSSQVNSLIELKCGSRVHSFTVRGKTEADQISGCVQTRSPIFGDLEADFDGCFRKGALKLEVKSNKLKKPIAVEGIIARQRVSFTAMTEILQMEGVLFAGQRFGFKGNMRDDNIARSYEIVALLEPGSSFKLSVELPWIPRSGVAVSKQAVANYTVEFDWLGTRALQAQWVGSHNTTLTGVVDAEIAIEGIQGRHHLVITHDFWKKLLLKLQVDGKTSSAGNSDGPRLNGKLSAWLARWEGLVIDFEHQWNETVWFNVLKFSQNGGGTVGYEAQIHEDIVGSMVRVDTPWRSFLLELFGRKSPTGDASVARFGWNRSQDQQKSLEVTWLKNNACEHLLTLSFPEAGEGRAVCATDADNVRHAPTSSGNVVHQHLRVGLLYLNHEKVRLNFGNLMLRAELSPKRSELIVGRMTAREQDINFGYSLHGKTLSARLHWSPRIYSNYQSLLRDALKEVQDEQGKIRRTFSFVQAEFAAIARDVQCMIDNLRNHHDENAYNLRTISEPVADVAESFSRWMEPVFEEVSRSFTRAKKHVDGYGARLSVASAVINAVQEEVREVIIDDIDRWIQHVEQYLQNESVRRLVGSLDQVKRDLKTLAYAFKFLVDKYVCEFSREPLQLTNKKCGFVYRLNFPKEQQGLMMRLPVAL